MGQIPTANANPRLSVKYALQNSQAPQTILDAQRAQTLGDALRSTTEAGENPTGWGGALANGLAALVRSRQLANLDTKLIGEGAQGQQTTANAHMGPAGISVSGGVAAPTVSQPPAPPAGAPANGQDPTAAPIAASVPDPTSFRDNYMAAAAQPDPGTDPMARNASPMLGAQSHAPTTATGGGDDSLVSADGTGSMPATRDPSALSMVDPASVSPQAIAMALLNGDGAQAQPAPMAQSPSDPQAAAAQPPQQVAMGGAPPGAAGFPGAAAPAAGDSAAGRVGPPISPQDRDALIRMTYGEARGEPVAGQQATAAVALNRSIMSGQPVSQIVSAPGQFEGMRVGSGLDPSSPAYQRIAAVVDPLLSGQSPDPSGGATHFYAPQAQAALGRAPPAWDDGSGRQIGNQLFFNKPFAGQQPSAPSSYQVAANGQTPPPPASAEAQMAPMPQAPQQVPVQTGPSASAAERQLMISYYNSGNPDLREQALTMADGIAKRQVSPIETDARWDQSTGQMVYTPKIAGYGGEVAVAPPPGWRPPLQTGMQYGPNGVAMTIPGTGYTDMGSPAPGVVLQRGPDGKLAPIEIPNAAAGAPAGTAWNGHAYAPVPGAQYGAPQPIAGTDTIAQRAPDGTFKSVGSLSLGPKDLQAIQTGYASTEPAKNYSEALAARRAMSDAAAQGNGAGDYAMLDTYARAINPGAVARLGTIEAIKQSRSIPDQIRGEVQRWGPNGGTLSPNSRQQLLNTTDAFVSSRWQALQPQLQDARAFAQRNGVDPSAVVPNFTPPPPPQPQGGGDAAILNDARSAIQRGAPRAAVIQRLQSMGVAIPAGAF